MAGCPAFIREFNVSIWISPTAPFSAVFQMTGLKKKIKLAKQHGQLKQIQEIEK